MLNLLRLLLPVLIVTGCASTGVRLEGQDPVVLVQSFSISMQAEFSGVLAFDAKSRCLRLRSVSGAGMEATPVWPEGTVPLQVRGKRGVSVRSVGAIVEGDRFRAAGGGSTWRAHPPRGVTIPEGCLPPGADGTVFIIGEVDEVQHETTR